MFIHLVVTAAVLVVVADVNDVIGVCIVFIIPGGLAIVVMMLLMVVYYCCNHQKMALCQKVDTACCCCQTATGCKVGMMLLLLPWMM